MKFSVEGDHFTSAQVRLETEDTIPYGVNLNMAIESSNCDLVLKDIPGTVGCKNVNIATDIDAQARYAGRGECGAAMKNGIPGKMIKEGSEITFTPFRS